MHIYADIFPSSVTILNIYDIVDLSTDYWSLEKQIRYAIDQALPCTFFPLTSHEVQCELIYPSQSTIFFNSPCTSTWDEQMEFQSAWNMLAHSIDADPMNIQQTLLVKAKVFLEYEGHDFKYVNSNC